MQAILLPPGLVSKERAGVIAKVVDLYDEDDLEDIVSDSIFNPVAMKVLERADLMEDFLRHVRFVDVNKAAFFILEAVFFSFLRRYAAIR